MSRRTGSLPSGAWLSGSCFRCIAFRRISWRPAGLSGLLTICRLDVQVSGIFTVLLSFIVLTPAVQTLLVFDQVPRPFFVRMKS